MNYKGVIYRPPVEADTFLLPVTEGCTHNSCSFCNMYQGILFRMLPLTLLMHLRLHCHRNASYHKIICQQVHGFTPARLHH